MGSEEANAVLIFLPGMKEIQGVQDALLATREYMHEPARSWVLPVHSAVPPEEQRLAFQRAPPGVRKVRYSSAAIARRARRPLSRRPHARARRTA